MPNLVTIKGKKSKEASSLRRNKRDRINTFTSIHTHTHTQGLFSALEGHFVQIFHFLIYVKEADQPGSGLNLLFSAPVWDQILTARGCWSLQDTRRLSAGSYVYTYTATGSKVKGRLCPRINGKQQSGAEDESKASALIAHEPG